MAKREDPFMLTHYRFLPASLKTRVDEFIDKLDETCKEFVKKRYIDGMSLGDIAEEMGYVERSIYLIREKVIDMWCLTLIDNDYKYHCNRILNAIRRYGTIDHYRLLNNLHFDRFGLGPKDFKCMIDMLLANGNIRIYFKLKPNDRRPKRKYTINNSANIQPIFSQKYLS